MCFVSRERGKEFLYLPLGAFNDGSRLVFAVFIVGSNYNVRVASL
jgi:hypothetical protein